MIEGESVLAVIVARGGSKGLPGKNLRPLGGKPMLAWSIAAAQASRHIDRLILSSDDSEIVEAARAFGCEVPFLRPAALASDHVAAGPVLVHAIDSLDARYDWLVLLQATSPLRLGSDIDDCLQLAQRQRSPAVISVTPAGKPPHWMMWLDTSGHMRRIVDPPEDAEVHARQLLPQAVVPNGAVYAARTEWFLERGTFYAPETLALVMPPERSVDVDTLLDFMLAEVIVQLAVAGPVDPQP